MNDDKQDMAARPLGSGVEREVRRHTPGPWTQQVVRTSSGVVFKIGPFPWKGDKQNHACIYADYPNTPQYAQCSANAHLIAAAPDLLEALQDMVHNFGSPRRDEWLNDKAFARAEAAVTAALVAIAKALTGDA